MRSARILSVDFGTNRCKVVLFDSQGAVISMSTQGVQTRSRGPGTEELDSQELRATLFNCLRNAVPASERRRVAMVSVTGQATSTVMLDAHGRAVRPIISHLDIRADGESKRLREVSGGMGYAALKIGGNLSWLRENEIRSFEKVRSVCDLKEYIGFLLTRMLTRDRLAMKDEEAREVGDFVGLDKSVFGEGHGYSTPIGPLDARSSALTGLQKGTPVLVCPWDGMTCVIGSGLVRIGPVAEVAGSTEVIATPVLADSRIATRDHLVPGLRLFYTSPPFGLAYEWFRRTFYEEEDNQSDGQYGAIERDVSHTSPRQDGPLFVPALTKGWLNWKIRGSLIGVDFAGSKGVVGRALMEGISMSVKKILEGLKVRDARGKELRLSGGGAKSDVWNQVKANITGREVALLQTVETGCLGAAVLAAEPLGLHEGLVPSADAMVHVTKRYKPNPSTAALYKKLYARFTIASARAEQSD